MSRREQEHGLGSRPDRERGSGSLWVLWLACVVWMAAVGATTVGAAVLARHRAAATADLAALAAADRALEGQRLACRAARIVAADMGATLSACALDGLVADVSAQVRMAVPLPATRVATVRARAGPAAAPRAAEDVSSGPSSGRAARSPQ